MINARDFTEEEDDEVEDPSHFEEEAETTRRGKQTDKKTSGGFHSFTPQMKGVLFKISPLSEEICSNIEKYMKEGFMQRDLAFIDTLYGLVAPSQRKDFSMFWESPWVEEQINDAPKKRKIEQQQRTMAVRSFIKASTQQESAPEDVDKFLNTVNKLTEWDNTTEEKGIKTVSRMVQSFEKKAVLTLLSFLEGGHQSRAYPMAMHHLQRLSGGNSALLADVDPITHALRRAPYTYVAFASLVSAELLLSEGTNGSRNTTINMSRRMDLEKFNAMNTMIDKLQKATVAVLPRDTMGLPLMQTSCNVCISRGVLVVSGKAAKATYVLDIDNLEELMQKHNKKNGQVIEISAQIFHDHHDNDNDPSHPQGQNAGRKTKKGRLSSSPSSTTSTTTALASLV